MSGGGSRSARCVFVGNIPYDATEEQLMDIFSEVGQVVSFRLVFDRDTGKPKGYGFCEYRDADTALSAMRNLSNRDFNGRQLRVDFAENEKANMQAAAAATQRAQAKPAAPQGAVPNFSNAASTPETVNNMLEGMSKPQLFDIVSKMKVLVQQNPDQARQLLLSNPPLAYALLQAQAMLGMVNMQTVQKLLAKSQSTMGMAPSMTPAAPTGGVPSMATGGMASASSTMPSAGMTGGMGLLGAAPVGPGAFGAPGYVNPSPMAPPLLSQLGDLPEQQRTLITQLLNLTPEQIELLPPDQRQQVQHLRQSIIGGYPQYG